MSKTVNSPASTHPLPQTGPSTHTRVEQIEKIYTQPPQPQQKSLFRKQGEKVINLNEDLQEPPIEKGGWR